MFYHFEPKDIRGVLSKARESAEQMKEAEEILIKDLYEVDRNRFYVWLGYKSFRSYCIDFLRLGRTQSQRIVTRVRRLEPTVKIEQ